MIAARPDVFNHNLETVPSKYVTVRPGARYFASLRLLQRAKELDPRIFTKSGIMLGLGEERNEVLQVMDDLRAANVDFLTIGQYLQPTRKHHEVVRFVPPEEFEALRDRRLCQGLPDGVVEPADALVAPCRRGFRAAARPRANPAGAEPHAAILHQRRVRHAAGGNVRPGGGCRALSGIRAAMPRPEGAKAHDKKEDGVEVLVADMTVAYKLVRETFTSRVTLDRPKLQILVEYLSGPFSRLQNRWNFRPGGRQCLRRGILHRIRIQEPRAGGC